VCLKHKPNLNECLCERASHGQGQWTEIQIRTPMKCKCTEIISIIPDEGFLRFEGWAVWLSEESIDF